MSSSWPTRNKEGSLGDITNGAQGYPPERGGGSWWISYRKLLGIHLKKGEFSEGYHIWSSRQPTENRGVLEATHRKHGGVFEGYHWRSSRQPTEKREGVLMDIKQGAWDNPSETGKGPWEISYTPHTRKSSSRNYISWFWASIASPLWVCHLFSVTLLWQGSAERGMLEGGMHWFQLVNHVYFSSSVQV